MKKIILSIVAMATISTGAFAEFTAYELNNMAKKNTVNVHRALICDDSYPGLSKPTQMALLKRQTGDLTFSSVARNGNIGVSKNTTMNILCWRYYKEVEDSSDANFKSKMERFINENVVDVGGGQGINLVSMYALKGFENQTNDILSSFLNSNSIDTKTLLNDYLFGQDKDELLAFLNEKNIDKKKQLYENYKSKGVSGSRFALKIMETYLTGSQQEYKLLAQELSRKIETK